MKSSLIESFSGFWRGCLEFSSSVRICLNSSNFPVPALKQETSDDCRGVCPRVFGGVDHELYVQRRLILALSTKGWQVRRCPPAGLSMPPKMLLKSEIDIPSCAQSAEAIYKIRPRKCSMQEQFHFVERNAVRTVIRSYGSSG